MNVRELTERVNQCITEATQYDDDSVVVKSIHDCMNNSKLLAFESEYVKRGSSRSTEEDKALYKTLEFAQNDAAKLSYRILNRSKTWEDVLRFGREVVRGHVQAPSYLGFVDLGGDRSFSDVSLKHLEELNNYMITTNGQDGNIYDRAYVECLAPQLFADYLVQQLQAKNGFSAYWSADDPSAMRRTTGLSLQRVKLSNGFFKSTLTMGPFGAHAPTDWVAAAPNLEGIFEENGVVQVNFWDTIFDRNTLLPTLIEIAKMYRLDWDQSEFAPADLSVFWSRPE